MEKNDYEKILESINNILNDNSTEQTDNFNNKLEVLKSVHKIIPELTVDEANEMSKKLEALMYQKGKEGLEIKIKDYAKFLSYILIDRISFLENQEKVIDILGTQESFISELGTSRVIKQVISGMRLKEEVDRWRDKINEVGQDYTGPVTRRNLEKFLKAKESLVDAYEVLGLDEIEKIMTMESSAYWKEKDDEFEKIDSEEEFEIFKDKIDKITAFFINTQKLRSQGTDDFNCLKSKDEMQQKIDEWTKSFEEKQSAKAEINQNGIEESIEQGNINELSGATNNKIMNKKELAEAIKQAETIEEVEVLEEQAKGFTQGDSESVKSIATKMKLYFLSKEHLGEEFIVKLVNNVEEYSSKKYREMREKDLIELKSLLKELAYVRCFLQGCKAKKIKVQGAVSAYEAFNIALDYYFEKQLGKYYASLDIEVRINEYLEPKLNEIMQEILEESEKVHNEAGAYENNNEVNYGGCDYSSSEDDVR